MRRATGVLGAVLLIGLTGCVEETGSDPDDGLGLAQGLTIFTSDPAAGLTGMYAEGDRAVLFDTHRALVAHPIEDPDPAYVEVMVDGQQRQIEVSARMLDMEGRDLWVVMGGESMPEAWVHDTPPVFGDEERANRGRDWALMRAAATAMAAADVPDDMRFEQARVAHMVNVNVDSLPAPAEVVDDDGVARSGPYTMIIVSQIDLVGPLAAHSAVAYLSDCAYGGSGCTYGAESCNHKNCGFAMRPSYVWQIAGTRTNSSWTRQYCDSRTGYGVCGFFGGDHNCHDDSRSQVYNLYYGSQAIPGWCNDWGCWNRYAWCPFGICW